MKNESPKTLKDPLKLIIPPKGVKRGKNANGLPTDEGNDLYDFDGMRYHIRLTLKVSSDH